VAIPYVRRLFSVWDAETRLQPTINFELIENMASKWFRLARFDERHPVPLLEGHFDDTRL
jgi:hypothetical protein